MSRVLLLMSTGTYRASAFLAAARRLGVDVVVGTDRVQALAGAHPEGHLTVDFDAPEEAAQNIAGAPHRPFNAVVAVDDDGLEVAAMVSAALGLRHHSAEAVRAARDKLVMRRRLEAISGGRPWFTTFPLAARPESAPRSVRYPCVLKPRSRWASQGVIRADNPPEFVEAFRRIHDLLRAGSGPRGRDSENDVLVEEFIPGPEIAVEGLVTNGVLRVLAIFDKPDPLDGPVFEETIYVTPSRLGDVDCAAVEGLLRAVVETLGLNHGPIHAELRLSPQGPRLIEIAPRSIGGLCSRALRFEGGAPLEELLLRHAIGESVDQFTRESQASGVMMMPIPRSGRLRAVYGLERARAVADVEDVRVTIPIGFEVVPLPEGSRYLGFIFARASTPERVVGALRVSHSHLRFDIGPEGPPRRDEGSDAPTPAVERFA